MEGVTKTEYYVYNFDNSERPLSILSLSWSTGQIFGVRKRLCPKFAKYCKRRWAMVQQLPRYRKTNQPDSGAPAGENNNYNSVSSEFINNDNIFSYVYSSTCHGRPPLVQRKSCPSWQVAPRDRERTYAPLCQIKHAHQTAYISQHMHNIMKHSGQLQCCIGLQWEMKRTMLKMCEKINSIYPQCNAYRWTHTCAVLYFKICRSNRRRFEMSHGNWPL